MLLLDGDLQHRPDEAERLLQTAAATGADLVIGERQFRRGIDAGATGNYANRLGSRVLSAFVGCPAWTRSADSGSARPNALRGLRLRSRGYEIETEMLIKLRRRGGSVVGAPVSAVYDGQPSKLRPVRDTTKTCLLAVDHRYIERLE